MREQGGNGERGTSMRGGKGKRVEWVNTNMRGSQECLNQAKNERDMVYLLF